MYQPVYDEIYKLANTSEDNRKLFVRGMNFETTVETVRRVFSEFGEVESVTVIPDKANPGKSRGYGFVLFKNMDCCAAALQRKELIIDGKAVYYNLAVEKDRTKRTAGPGVEAGMGGGGGGGAAGGAGAMGSGRGGSAAAGGAGMGGAMGMGGMGGMMGGMGPMGAAGPGAFGAGSLIPFGPGAGGMGGMGRGAGTMSDKKDRCFFVRSLPFDLTGDELKMAFQQFGEIEEATVVQDKANPGRNRGYGFVTFRFLEPAQHVRGISSLNIRGRDVQISLKSDGSGGGGGAGAGAAGGAGGGLGSFGGLGGPGGMGMAGGLPGLMGGMAGMGGMGMLGAGMPGMGGAMAGGPGAGPAGPYSGMMAAAMGHPMMPGAGMGGGPFGAMGGPGGFFPGAPGAPAGPMNGPMDGRM